MATQKQLKMNFIVAKQTLQSMINVRYTCGISPVIPHTLKGIMIEKSPLSSQ